MLHELVPFVSCYATYPDIEVALSTYPEVYISTEAGNFKHTKLPNGRHARIKINALPKFPAVKIATNIEEDLNFLPAGKVPSHLFDQIVEFFRQVIVVKNASFEAHAWILWNKDKGYYVSVPPQKVSAANVHFDYTKEALPEGDIIVVDLHSHGSSMGAFWSGTDNNNDRSGIYYSGVIGKIKPEPNGEYEYVIRFNLYEDKKICKLEDVFEFPEEKIPQVPKEWLDKVQVNSPVNTGKWINKVSPPAGYKSLWEQFGKNEAPTGKESRRAEKKPENSLSQEEQNLRKKVLLGICTPSEEKFALDRKIVTEEELNSELDKFPFPKSLLDSFNEELFTINPKTGCPELIEETYVPGPQDEEDEDDPVGRMGGEYEYYAQQYNTDVADAKDAIDTDIPILSGCDEALVDIIRQAYDLLGEKGRAELANNGF